MLALKILISVAVLFSVFTTIANETDGIVYKFQYYKDNNVVSVKTNTFAVNKTLGEHFKANVNYLSDAITGASRKDYKQVDASTSASVDVDAMTSASQTDETRRQIGGSFSFVNDFIKQFRKDKTSGDDPTTLTVIGSYSSEHDYTSKTVSFSFAQDLFQRNTTFSAIIGRSYDDYHPVSRYEPDSTDTGWNFFSNRDNGDRMTDRVSVSLTQGLTVTTVAEIILGYVYDRGYLSRPYYVYNFDGQLLGENLPAKRKIRTATLLFNQYIPVFNGSSLQLNYRFYQDDWNMTSHTLDTKLFMRFAERFIIRPSYRYYFQTEAFFYRDEYKKSEFPNGPKYLTTDFKYRRGVTNSFGLKLIYEIKDFVKPESEYFLTLIPTSFDISFDYYMRSGSDNVNIRNSHYNYWPTDVGFRAFYIQSGATFSF